MSETRIGVAIGNVMFKNLNNMALLLSKTVTSLFPTLSMKDKCMSVELLLTDSLLLVLVLHHGLLVPVQRTFKLN